MPLDDKIRTSHELDDSVEMPSTSDFAILKAIGADGDAQQYSFQGIRRKLGLHQETLSRALHRLQRDGFIQRMEHSYAISKKGQSTISLGKLGEHIGFRDPNSVILLQSVLPSDLNQQLLVDSMCYRWFGNLRWLGSASKNGTTTLSWITIETGLTIFVRIKDSTLTIETYPKDTNSVPEATRSAFELFDHISRSMKASDRSGLTRKSTAS